MPSVGQLTIRRTREGARNTLGLAGELDLVTAPGLEDLIAGLCVDGAGELVLDMRQVIFMDSSGLRTVLAAMDMCRLHGCEFMLVADTGPCRRLFELTGVIDDLPLRRPEELAEPA
jgi:anti-anti-sigma factor